MTATVAHPCIVVGVDGSRASLTAVAHAVRMAGESGSVILVHAHDLPADWIGRPDYQEALNREAERGAGVLQTAAALIPEGLDHKLEEIGGRPAEALATIADVRQADAIVIGTRGFGRMRALLGSVAHELIHLAECPVTVIPERVVDRQEAAELQEV